MRAIFRVSTNCGLLSSPFALAASDIAMIRGRACSSWRFNCGVTLGASPLAIFSNCARVISVLQSAGLLAGAVLAVAAFDVATVFAAGAHTPLMVNTTALSGTSVAGSGALAAAACAGIPGWACPHASVPNNTHSNQLLLIQAFLQDWQIRKFRSPNLAS